MQTFMPYSDFAKSAKVLDRARLGKQRVEVLQILKAMDSNKGWANHPCTKMWRGHKVALIRYGIAVCDEWIARGYKDTCRAKLLHILSETDGSPDAPKWIGDEEVHASHRSNLLRKDTAWYSQFQWSESPDMEYKWVTQ